MLNFPRFRWERITSVPDIRRVAMTDARVTQVKNPVYYPGLALPVPTVIGYRL